MIATIILTPVAIALLVPRLGLGGASAGAVYAAGFAAVFVLYSGANLRPISISSSPRRFALKIARDGINTGEMGCVAVGFRRKRPRINEKIFHLGLCSCFYEDRLCLVRRDALALHGTRFWRGHRAGPPIFCRPQRLRQLAGYENGTGGTFNICLRVSAVVGMMRVRELTAFTAVARFDQLRSRPTPLANLTSPAYGCVPPHAA